MIHHDLSWRIITHMPCLHTIEQNKYTIAGSNTVPIQFYWSKIEFIERCGICVSPTDLVYAMLFSANGPPIQTNKARDGTPTTHIYIYIYIERERGTQTYAYLFIYLSIYLYMYVYIYIYIYIYMYIYIYISEVAGWG